MLSAKRTSLYLSVDVMYTAGGMYVFFCFCFLTSILPAYLSISVLPQSLWNSITNTAHCLSERKNTIKVLKAKVS